MSITSDATMFEMMGTVIQSVLTRTLRMVMGLVLWLIRRMLRMIRLHRVHDCIVTIITGSVITTTVTRVAHMVVVHTRHRRHTEAVFIEQGVIRRHHRGRPFTGTRCHHHPGMGRL